MRIKACIDTETTGLIAGVNEIIQIAVVIMDDDFKFVDKFVSLVKPMHEGNINLDALKVNRIKMDDLLSAPTPLQVRNAFFQWHEEVHDSMMIEPLGHNYMFDRDFLKIFFGNDLYAEKFYYKTRDTFTLAQALIDRGSLDVGSTSLIGLCEHFDIPIKAHNALGDVLATMNLYRKLLEVI